MGLMEEGYAGRRRGDRVAALGCFEQALAADPGNPGIRLEVAHELRALRRLESAEVAYQAVLDLLPGHLDALLALAECARLRHDRAAALAWFERVLTVAPANAAARLGAGDEARALRRPEDAEIHYLALLAGEPKHGRALLAMAECCRMRDDRAAAFTWLDRAVAADPDNAAVRLRAAEELRALGRLDAAEAMFATLLTQRPDHPGAWLGLGRVRHAAGRHLAALEAFDRAHAADPAQPQPLLEMASQHRILGRPREAEALLRRVLALDGDNGWAHLHLGEHCRMADDFAGALACFGRAHALMPAETFATTGLARALAETGRLDDAIALLDAAEAGHGPRPDLAAMRVQLLRVAGEWPQALAAAAEAEAGSPWHFGLWMECCKTARVSGDAVAVEAYLARVPARTAAEQGRVHHFRGHHTEDGWMIDEAIGHYGQALALLPEDGGVHQSLARARMLAVELNAATGHLEVLTRIEASKLALQSRAANASQSQLGQIIDEFRCDPEAFRRLLAVRGLPPAERASALLPLARRYPDYTPAAMQLMLALRQAGRLHRTPTPVPIPAIPRRLVQYWHEPMPPADVRALLDGWKARHPDFDCQVFDDARATAFIAARHGGEVLRAYRRAREPAQRADLFRLAWLAAEGGFYADTDDRCLAHLSAIVPDDARLFGYLEEYGALANNVLGAVPGEPVTVRALDLAARAVNRGDRDILWLSTGPGVLTRAYATTLATESWAETTAAARHVIDRRQLFAAVAIHCFLPYKKTRAHWLQAAFGASGKGGGSRVSLTLPARP